MKSILLKNDNGHLVRLDQFPAVLGRSEEAAVHLTNVLASRRHCEIVDRQHGLCIRDLASVNGTIVNGTLLARDASGESSPEELQLEDGDEIIIGSDLFCVLSVNCDELTTRDTRQDSVHQTTFGERIFSLLRIKERRGSRVHSS